MKFKHIYRDYFHRDISIQEAQGKGEKLLRMFKLIYKPMTQEDFERLQKRREETKDFN